MKHVQSKKKTHFNAFFFVQSNIKVRAAYTETGSKSLIIDLTWKNPEKIALACLNNRTLLNFNFKATKRTLTKFMDHQMTIKGVETLTQFSHFYLLKIVVLSYNCCLRYINAEELCKNSVIMISSINSLAQLHPIHAQNFNKNSIDIHDDWNCCFCQNAFLIFTKYPKIGHRTKSKIPKEK